MYKLLIIEDEKLLREGLIQMLDFERFQLVLCGEASNGREGIRKIRQLKPDIILLDLYMPIVSGMDVLKKTRDSHDYEAIIITGYAEFEHAQQAISLGVSDYLLKPIDKNALNSAIEKVTQKLGPAVQSYDENYSQYTNYTYSYIEKHLGENLSLQEIATQLGITSDHLNRVFKKDTRMTVHQAVILKRIERACELLKNEDNRVYEVAHQVGYKDYKYFHQVFKKETGLSPKAYQQAILKQRAK